MSKVHTKKILKKYYDRILSGDKTYEVRLADWQCDEDDILELVEVDGETKKPTGRTIRKKVGAVIRTKELENLGWWSKENIEEYGFQVLALIDEDTI